MNQIILISQDHDLRQSLDEECLSLRQCLFTSFETVDEMLPLIELFTGHELVIVDGRSLPDVDQVTTNLLSWKEKFSKYLFYSDNPSSPSPEFVLVPNRIELTFHLKQAEFLHLNSDKFMAISLETLSHFDCLPFPLFIGLSAERFVKRIPAFETLDAEILKGYQERGITEFFFERIYSKDFTHLLMNHLSKKLDQPEANREEQELVASLAFSAIREITSAVGLQPKVFELCQKLISQMTQAVKAMGDRDMVDYLERLRSRPELDFHYRHTQLTACLASELLSMNLFRGESGCLTDMIFAAFFADMSLRNPSHIHLRRAEDLEEMREDDAKAIAEHAASSAELVAFDQVCSKEALRVIHQHHGSLDGKGFPELPEKEIEELSQCFMTAYELSYSLLTSEGGIWSVCQELADKYQGSVLSPFILSFEKNLLKRTSHS